MLGVLVLVWLVTVAIVVMRAGMCRASDSHEPCRHAPYTLVRICGGNEPSLLANLTSVTAARGPKPSRMLLVVPHDDVQLQTVHAARTSLMAQGMTTHVVETRVRSANHKVAQLAAALDPASSEGSPSLADMVVCADGDVNLTDFPMHQLLAPLTQRDVAAAWAPVVEVVPQQAPWGSYASAAVLSSSLHCFALLGRIDRGGMVGKLWAYHPALLAAAGGWG